MDFENIALEWKECRSAVARFDDYLLKLRLLGFSIFTLVFSAITGVSGASAQKVGVSPRALLLAIIVLFIFLLAIYTLDRYYERMLLVAVLRASRLEAHRPGGFRIGLTTEIEFQKKRYQKRIKKVRLSKIAQASVMVNLVYLLMFVVVCTQFFITLSRSHFPRIYFAGLFIVPIIALGVALAENSLLKEPNQLIKQRSSIVNSPVLFSGDEIRYTVGRMARDIVQWTTRARIRDLQLVCTLPSARRFLEDLLKEMEGNKSAPDFHLHFIHLRERPEAGPTVAGCQVLCGTLDPGAFRGSAVLVVTDLVSTGETLKGVVEAIRPFRPRIIKTAALVQKRIAAAVRPDFIGLPLALDEERLASLNAKDCRLFGYGLDYEGHYREFDHIGWVPVPRDQRT